MNLQKINRVLLSLILAINLFIIFKPLLPYLTWEIKKSISESKREKLEKLALPSIGNSGSNDQLPTGNWVIIPELLLEEEINEGHTISTANKGVWRRPTSSTPSGGSNTILAGHRFTYTGNSVFYHLDKINIGSKIVVIWEGHKYVYETVEVKEVEAKDITVEKPSEDARLTMYTCTPLWSAENRLVITAELII